MVDMNVHPTGSVHNPFSIYDLKGKIPTDYTDYLDCVLYLAVVLNYRKRPLIYWLEKFQEI
jgi:hypothetical protein